MTNCARSPLSNFKPLPAALVNASEPTVALCVGDGMVGLLIESRGPATRLEISGTPYIAGPNVRCSDRFRSGRSLSIPLENGLHSVGGQVCCPSCPRWLVAVRALLEGCLDRVRGRWRARRSGRPIGNCTTLFCRAPGRSNESTSGGPLVTGIRAIRGLPSPAGKDTRGIVPAAARRKSTLLGSMWRNSEDEVCVIALIGEAPRGAPLSRSRFWARKRAASWSWCATSDLPRSASNTGLLCRPGSQSIFATNRRARAPGDGPR